MNKIFWMLILLLPTSALAESNIVLNFAYRTSVEIPHLQEKKIRISYDNFNLVEPVILIDDSKTKSIELGNFKVDILLSTENLTLFFYEKNRDFLIQQTSYPIFNELTNVFETHGFTGLHYIYQKSGEEIQYWATTISN